MASSPGNDRREHVVGLDEKALQPLRNLQTDRVNKSTGELRRVRQDTARQRYGEGGVEGLVWGTEFTIASVRSRPANQRRPRHRPLRLHHTRGRELHGHRPRTGTRTPRAGHPRVHADGAWRGTHLNQIQTHSGCGVIAPARRRTARKGGILIDGRGSATQPLPGVIGEPNARPHVAATSCGWWPGPSSSRSSPHTGRASTGSSPATRPDETPPATRTGPSATSSKATTPCRALRILTTCDGSRFSPQTPDTQTGFNRTAYLRVAPPKWDRGSVSRDQRFKSRTTGAEPASSPRAFVDHRW